MSKPTGNPRGKPRKQGHPKHEAPASREEYVSMLMAELGAATADLARVNLLTKIGSALGFDSPEMEVPQLRAGGRLPAEKTELLWLRTAILRQANGGRLGSTMVESLRAIRARLDDLAREAPPTPEEEEAALIEDLPKWPDHHVVLAVKEAIRRGILQA